MLLIYVVSERGVVFFRKQDIGVEDQKVLGQKLGEVSLCNTGRLLSDGNSCLGNHPPPLFTYTQPPRIPPPRVTRSRCKSQPTACLQMLTWQYHVGAPSRVLPPGRLPHRLTPVAQRHHL
jgi:hypothetical protein